MRRKARLISGGLTMLCALFLAIPAATAAPLDVPPGAATSPPPDDGAASDDGGAPDDGAASDDGTAADDGDSMDDDADLDGGAELLGPDPSAAPVETEVETFPLTDDDAVVVPTGGLRVVGATWEGAAQDAHIEVRSHDGQDWSDWQHLHVHESEDADPDLPAGTEPVALDGEQIEARVHASSQVEVEVTVIDPGAASADSQSAQAGTFSLSSPTSPPQIRSRDAWGADETIRSWRPQAGRVTGAVVHHTAGTNNYSRDQVPPIIRGIYTFHAQTRGWGDIGYNVLVDRFGQAWEGRYGGLQNPVIGAHAVGANSTMFGISVMGDFTSTEVPQAAFSQVARVIGWKFSLHGITTSGSSTGPNGPMNRIIGHRDVQNTSCPGTRFYARFGELRNLVRDYQAANPPRSTPPYREVRLAGPDRYGTAVESSRWSYGRPDTVLVATAQDYADALAAGPAAVAESAPVLLVQPNRVPAAVAEELRRIAPDRIVVLGGTDAISNTVVNQLRRHAPVQRLDGVDRYETAALVARDSFSPSDVDEVWISTGEEYPDALTGGSAAARREVPMLLARGRGLPEATASALSRMSPSRVVVVGGTSAINNNVLSQVRAQVPGAAVQRIAGADRYQTSTRVAEHAWPGTASTVFYATGLDWPDALTGVPAAGQRAAPLLLLRGDCAPSPVRSATGSFNPSLVFLLGGPRALANGALERGC